VDLYPAIDLRGGRVVRLSQGEAARETSYHTDPVAQAEQFVADGARWLHVVDLDRAFGTGDNLTVIRSIVSGVGGQTSIQVGGGIRSLEALTAVLELGVSRAVLGTAVVTDPALVPSALRAVGENRLAVGLDTKGGYIAIRGWVETTPFSALDICRRVLDAGMKTIIYTDVARDGMLAGPDLEGACELKALGAAVIVSGGVGSLTDLMAAKPLGLAGVIVGRALYEGKIQVRQALNLLRQ